MRTEEAQEIAARQIISILKRTTNNIHTTLFPHRLPNPCVVRMSEGKGSNSNTKRLLSGDDQPKLEVVWMKHTDANFYFYFLCCLLSLGLVYIWCLLYPSWKEWFLSSPCSPNEADSVSTKINKELKVTPVIRNIVDGQPILSIEVNCRRYYTSESDGWDFLCVPDVPIHFSHYLKPVPSQSKVIASRDTLLALYGTNKMELPKASFWDILTVTIFHPFYLFQYFAVVVWMIEDYILYSCVIFLTTAGAIYATTSETMFNLRRLYDLAGASSIVTVVKENGERLEMSDHDLVPGDRFLIKFGTSLPCDAVLVSGRVSVDESMLTGESVPVNKTPIELSVFQGAIDSEDIVLSKLPGNVLFSGTRVLLTSGSGASNADSPESHSQPAGDCIAVVYRTGFRSAKGQLISTLLNPKENFMSFFSDALWVILFMAVLCTSLYIWSAVYLRENEASWSDICIKYLDAITIAVPPALTASLTVATGISINRLRNRDIFVSESTRVNWAGIVGFAAFDKTGTLTEERLHFKGVTVPLHLSEVKDPTFFFSDSARGISNGSVEIHSERTDIPTPCIELMATCHALALIDGVAVGDPLEVEMFRASGFSMASSGSAILSVHSPGPPLPSTQYDVLRHFEFTSDRARAGSLIRRPNNDIIYYSKGSPEAILKLVDQTTVPSDIHSTLTTLSKRGLRVLAMSYQIISRGVTDHSEVLKFSQSDLEQSSIFLGLIFLSNALKADTLSTINALRGADIKCNMITGDHIHTAIAIATDCGLLVEDQEVFIIDAATDSVSGLSVSIAATGEVVTTNITEFLNTKPAHHHHTQIAITGFGLEVVKLRHSHMIKLLLESIQVFARMKPSDKQFIVEQLQHLTEKDAKDMFVDEDPRASISNDMIQISSDLPQKANQSFRKSVLDNVALMMDDDGRGALHVIFCGDGANDMAALRAATVGVSLCEAETSVAAPVTSRLQTPGAVVEVIKEGRCSLITAYVLVAFNIMYGTIQLFMAIMMYNFGLEIGNNTYLIQDLFYTLILGLAISITPPSQTLSKELPPQRFFTKYFCFKLFSQLICFPIFQLIALEALKRQSWYVKYEFGSNPLSETYAYETSVVASMGLAQVMIASVVSTIDEPFRRNWYTNKYHVMALVFQTGFLLYQIFGRESYFMREILEIRPLKIDFCWILILIMIANCVVSGLLSWLADIIKHLSQRNDFMKAK